MKLKFICPFWGQKSEDYQQVVQTVKQAGYDGMELNIVSSSIRAASIVHELQQNELLFIGQQWLPPATETVQEYINRYESNLYAIAQLNPLFINSHTGKDYFSFEDNCKIVELAKTFTQETGIPIYHETHRGRFPFHAATTLAYLERFPDLQFTADLSHWCTVSESLLQDQKDTLQKLLPCMSYVHARIGYEHSPQVNDPRAPEWKMHLETYFSWWDEIVAYHVNKGTSMLAFCPEFGPKPYMPAMPYSCEPLANQWDVNDWMFHQLKQRYASLPTVTTA